MSGTVITLQGRNQEKLWRRHWQCPRLNYFPTLYSSSAVFYFPLSKTTSNKNEEKHLGLPHIYYDPALKLTLININSAFNTSLPCEETWRHFLGDSAVYLYTGLGDIAECGSLEFDLIESDWLTLICCWFQIKQLVKSSKLVKRLDMFWWWQQIMAMLNRCSVSKVVLIQHTPLTEVTDYLNLGSLHQQ